MINNAAVSFFRELGSKRIILPRHLTVSEIVELKKNAKGIEIEAFIMNEGCKNVDGFCEFLHGLTDRYDKEVMACTIPYSVDVWGVGGSCRIGFREQRTIKRRIADMFKGYKVGCGVCSLHDLYSAGIDSLKIVGRGMRTGRKVADVRLIKEKIDEITGGVGRKEYLENCKEEFREMFHRRCRSYDCYYPDML